MSISGKLKQLVVVFIITLILVTIPAVLCVEFADKYETMYVNYKMDYDFLMSSDARQTATLKWMELGRRFNFVNDEFTVVVAESMEIYSKLKAGTSSSEELVKLQDNVKSMQAMLKAEVGRAELIYKTLVFMGLKGSAITMIVSLTAIVFISRSTRKSIVSNVDSLSSEIIRFSDGELNISINKAKKSELNPIIDAIHKASQLLSVIISDAKKSLHLVKSSSQDLSGKLQSAKDRITFNVGKITTEIEELTQSVSDISITSEEIANGASATAESASNAAAMSSQATNSVSELKKIIDYLAVAVNESVSESKSVSVSVDELLSAIQEVSVMVSSIENISGQINLLALNATIEAARAGEYGKGFGVVAFEVRTLSDATKTLTSNINSVTRALQQKSAAVKDSVTSSVFSANTALGLTVSSAPVFDKTLDSVNELNDAIQSIAAISEEQAASSQEISASVEVVTQVMTETSESISTLKEDIAELITECVDAHSELETQVDLINGNLEYFSVA